MGTGRNFREMVQEGTTLVAFHAPWCGGCKRIYPKLGEIADMGHRVLMVEGTENEVSGVSVERFPDVRVWRDGVEGERWGGGDGNDLEVREGWTVQCSASQQQRKETLTPFASSPASRFGGTRRLHLSFRFRRRKMEIVGIRNTRRPHPRYCIRGM